jgi:hypothetical protein
MVDLLKKARWLSLASLVALATAGAVGCAADSPDDHAVSGDDGSSKDDITQVSHTKVKRQSIGNCWLYATTSWLEALNKGATNEEKNTSESWLTYWHWFEQIANGGVSKEISTGGSYGTAADLIARYGIMMEEDFIPSEANDEMSRRQQQALQAINRSLKEGVLSNPAARRDRRQVRKELDAAWGLDEETIRRIDAVFGPGVERTLDRSRYANENAAASKVIRPADFEARLKDPDTGKFVIGTLADAIGKGRGWWAPREGKFAFNEVWYPTNASQRRAFWKRVQKALHDEIPVIMSWKVDFNALTRDSRFSKAELDKRGPGRQGGHMTVMHDYQAEVPGFGLLKAGVQATREQMEAALSDGTKIQFIRVKNSWGGIRPDRWDDAVLPGYHDLEMDYLNGPIKDCSEDAEGNTNPNDCQGSVTPLWDVVLPAGY